METEHILAEHPDVAIQTLQDKIIKDMDGLPLLLTSEEFRILRIMLKTAAPMTTQGIANCYASLMLNDLCEKVQPQKNSKTTEARNLSAIVAGMKKLSKTMQAHEVAGFIKKSLKAAGWDVPRFETIDGCLKSLFQLGIISRRIDPNKQGKQLWFLNPKFYMLWSERRNEIQKNKIQRDKADSRLILFYNMD